MSVDQEFLRETDDAIRQLTVELVELEESTDRETLDEAFRRTHGLKGNLGMVGLEDARDLAHALEDVLDAIRAGERPADQSAIDAALDAADEIGRTVEQAHRGESTPDLDGLTARLRSLAEPTDADVSPPPSGADTDGTGDEGVDVGGADEGDEDDADGDDDAGNEMEDAGFVFEPAGEGVDGTAESDADDGEPEFDDEVEAALADASEFDDLDALVDEVDDADAFADLDGGGSFDDVLEDSPDADLGDPVADEGLEHSVDDGGLDADGLDAESFDADSLDADDPDEVAGDAFEEPTEDVLEEPTEDILDEPTDDVLDDPTEDVLDEPSGDVLDAPAEADPEEPADADHGEPAEADHDGLTEDDIDELTEDIKDDPAESISDEPAGDAVAGEDADADDAPSDGASAAEDAPSSPGGAFTEFQEIQAEVERDDDLDQLQQDIEETNFGEFDDEDDMTIDELLLTEAGEPAAGDEPDVAGAEPEPAAEEPEPEPEPGTVDAAEPDRRAPAEASPEPTEAAEASPDADPAAEEPEPEPAIEPVEEPATADPGPSTAGSEPETVDPEPAIHEVTDAGPPAVEPAVRELPESESEPEPEPEPAIREIPETEPAAVEDEVYEPAITEVEPAEPADEPEPVVEEVVEPTDEEVVEPAVEEVSEPAGKDVIEPAIEEVPEPASADATDEPGRTDGVEPEPAAAGSDEDLDAEVEALLSEVDVSEADEPVDASFETGSADAESGGGLSGFARDEATDAFEDRFGDLFAGDPESERSDARTVPTIADSDLDPAAFGDDRSEGQGLPARQRTTAPASLSVDPEVGDELLRHVRELAAAGRRLAATADQTDPEVRDALSALQSATGDVRRTALEVRLMPLSTVTDGFGRVVRDVAREAGVEVSFETHGTDVHLDRDVLDRIGDPLVHLVRNAVDHGIEAPDAREAVDKPREGTVELRARREGDSATIEVRDDGGGLDPEAIRESAVDGGLVTEGEAAALSRRETFDLLFEPGFSTTDEVTERSGRGVGMDAVERAVSDLNGAVAVESEPGEGTTVRLSVPVTVAVAEVVFLEVGDEQYAVPTADVETVQYATETVVEDGTVTVPTGDGDESYPLVRLGEALGAADGGSERVVVRVDPDVRGVALGADDVGEKREVVITPYEEVLGGTPGLGGATLLEDNTVVNVIDVETL